MTPELYQRLKPLYDAAIATPKVDRAQFVARACGEDTALRDELEALLASHDEKTSSFDQPLVNLRKFNGLRKQALRDGDLLLKRFRIVRLLGFGGMGEVYEVEDSYLQGAHVALKTILPHIAGDQELQKRFQREVLLAREVVHPNLCPIYDIDHCDEPAPGFLFLTMKLLPGETLAARLRRETSIPVDEGLAILKNVALGIVAIHSAGIIHRDIKPNNIILDGAAQDMRLWITDFGLARAYQTESTTSGEGLLAGTMGYVAPELFRGCPPSQGSDLFALGVVLHEVFTAEKPVPIPNSASCVVSNRLSAPNVPGFCVRLITECLHEDPRRRCQAFSQALETIDPKIDRAPYSIMTRSYWTRRRFIGAAAAGICVASGGAWWKSDQLEGVLQDWQHPLPQKRFVALLNWPKTSDTSVSPMLTGVLAAIRTELSRVESFDRNFFVISPEEDPGGPVKSDRLQEISDPLGANLVLAASGLPGSGQFQVLLRLLDPSSNHVLRERRVSAALAQLTSLPGKAAHAAGSLLNLNRYMRKNTQAASTTKSAAAYTAFQSAEALIAQPNDAGVEEAIKKYKEAVELDPQYVVAHAELALAYVQLYGINRDAAALDLARANSQHALALDPGSVDGHLAKALVLEKLGDEEGALGEFAKALALDPSNPRTLVLQAQVYTRLNRWADAEHTYERLQDQRPNFWVTYNEKGWALDRQGKYPEAVRAFRAATLAAPANSLASANLGSEYLQIGNYAEAAQSSKRSFELRPNDLAASNASLALRMQGKPHDALPFALKAVELNPAVDTNWLELGECYFSMGNRRSEARAAYTRAAREAERHLQTDTTDGPGWMSLALYEVKAGNSQNALSLVEKAEALGARDMESQLYKARILELIGKRGDALSTLYGCFRRGATDFQVASFPDLQALRKDPRYLQMMPAKPINMFQAAT